MFTLCYTINGIAQLETVYPVGTTRCAKLTSFGDSAMRWPARLEFHLLSVG